VANQCIERKYCMRDKDCPGDQVCDRNSCIAPHSYAAPGGPTTWGSAPVSREQSAARDAGMALLYTKNTWPTSFADRPLMVAPGMTEVQLNISKDISVDPPGLVTAKPLGGALFARFGLSDRLHAVLDS